MRGDIELPANSADDLAFGTLEDVSQALDARRVSSGELVDLYLGRISRLDPKLHAFVRVFEEAARQAANAADIARKAGRSPGPFHGIPCAIKDIFDYAGSPTEVGSRALEGGVSSSTATAVRRLEMAGMIVLGKTHMVEFAFGGWGLNPITGTPWNPWDLETHRVPGGSSSGSAVAVTAGMVPVGLGTDTGGSCRTPVAFCGCIGLKTSRGLVGRGGVVPLSLSHDTVGPITRSVRDSALLLDVLAGFDPQDPSTSGAPRIYSLEDIERGIDGFRIGRLSDPDLEGVEPEILALHDKALSDLQSLGAKIEELRLPRSLDDYLRDGGGIMSAEAYANFGHLVDSPDSVVDPVIRERILAGKEVSAAEYIRLLESRRAAQFEIRQRMDMLDAFVAPTCPAATIPVAEVDEKKTTTQFGRFVNFLDLASLSVPAGLTASGLPAAIQIVVRQFDDALALRIGRALERMRDGLVRQPPELRRYL